MSIFSVSPFISYFPYILSLGWGWAKFFVKLVYQKTKIVSLQQASNTVNAAKSTQGARNSLKHRDKTPATLFRHWKASSVAPLSALNGQRFACNCYVKKCCDNLWLAAVFHTTVGKLESETDVDLGWCLTVNPTNHTALTGSIQSLLSRHWEVHFPSCSGGP